MSSTTSTPLVVSLLILFSPFSSSAGPLPPHTVITNVCRSIANRHRSIHYTFCHQILSGEPPSTHSLACGATRLAKEWENAMVEKVNGMEVHGDCLDDNGRLEKAAENCGTFYQTAFGYSERANEAADSKKYAHARELLKKSLQNIRQCERQLSGSPAVVKAFLEDDSMRNVMLVKIASVLLHRAELNIN